MALAQTSDGFLWLASSQGLYRFDGVEFELFDPPGSPLPAPTIYSLLACPNGDLWVGSAVSGVSLIRNGTNHNYGAADGVPDGAVLSLAQDRQGAIWAATQGGLAHFDGEKWRKLGPESGFQGVPTSVYGSRGGTLWASSPDSVFALPSGSKVFDRRLHGTAWVMHMQESPNGTMWMAETARAVRPMPPSQNDPEIQMGAQRILFDRDGGLWIPTLGDGLRRVPYPDRLTHEKFSKSSEDIERFTSKDGLSGDYATAILQDREGNIWVGTAGGLDRFSKGPILTAPAPAGLSRTTIAPGDGGDVWVGGLSKSSGRIHDNLWFPGPELTAFAIVPSPSSGTWWASYGTGLREVNGRFTAFEYPGAYKLNPEPVRMAVDRTESVWISGAQGIFVRRKGAWSAVETPASVTGKTATLAYADDAGRVWFGFKENLIFLIDQSARRVISSQDGLRVGAVLAISVHGACTWIGGSKGLQLFDGQSLRDVTPAKGSTFGSVSGVLETSDGALWLNAARGIIRIAPPEVAKLKAGNGSVEYSVFDSHDGLPGATQQNQPYPTLIQAKDGKLWFSSSLGPVWIDPNDIPRNTIPPPVAIHSVTAGGKRYDSFANLRLPALTRDLEISYTALSFTVPERVQFRYRLDGLDTSWHEAGTRRRAFYSNLGPGAYRFRVMACNNDGVWDEGDVGASFRIDPAFHQTTWFRLLSYAAGFALLWGMYRLRLQQATAEVQSRLEGRNAERERIARELHDTLLQSFQGLMLRLQLVEDLLPPGKAKEQLEQSLQRADEAIAEGRRAVHELRASAVVDTDLSEALRAAAGELVSDRSPTFRLLVEGNVRNLHPMIRDELYRIGCEALRNAFHHGQAGKVEAELIYGDRVFRLRIRDDGIGIPADVLSKGRSEHYGLTGMRERARQAGGSLEIWSAGGRGTEIEVSIPGAIAYRTSRDGSLFGQFSKNL